MGLTVIPENKFTAPSELVVPMQPYRKCDPTAKPGVVRFKNLLLESYGEHVWGIVRQCHIGGRSEHKDGRALDFHLVLPGEAEQTADLIKWLGAADSRGKWAMARRLGVMYLISNRVYYQPGTTPVVRPYRGRSPHTDHMHLSFSHAGALGTTSFWSRVA